MTIRCLPACMYLSNSLVHQNHLCSCWKFYPFGLFFQILFSAGLTQVTSIHFLMDAIKEFFKHCFGSDLKVSKCCASNFVLDLVMSQLLNEIVMRAQSPQWAQSYNISKGICREDGSGRFVLVRGSWGTAVPFLPFIPLEKLHLITRLPWKHWCLMFFHGRCAKLARFHFNLSFTGSHNEVLTSQQMGFPNQFCLPLGGSMDQCVPECMAFTSHGLV